MIVEAIITGVSMIYSAYLIGSAIEAAAEMISDEEEE